MLLSPTYGMHLYTADLARTAVREGKRKKEEGRSAGVRVVTTSTAPRGVYGDGVEVLTPVATHGTGFSREGMNVAAYRHLQSSILNLQSSIVHFTGVHLWNVPLVYALRRRGVRVVHTLHDLAPHSGVSHGGLIRLWNRLVIGSGAEILVHGRCWREQLIREGVDARRVVWAPLLHGFTADGRLTSEDVKTEIVDRRDVIFFGRIEAYKGVEVLVEAWRRTQPKAALEGDRSFDCAPSGRSAQDAYRSSAQDALAPSTAPLRGSAQDAYASYDQDAYRSSAQDVYGGWRLVLAGKVGKGVALGELPQGVEVRDRVIGDEEALALFGGAALLVLPYRDATQSALIGAAARLGVPSLATRTGALPEYVVEGETGWVVEPGDPQALAEGLREALGDRERLARFGTAARSWYDAAKVEERRILSQLYSPARLQTSI